MNALLLNRDFALPDDGWFHVVPLGEFPHPEGVVQVFDAEGAKQMVNRFKTAAAKPNFPGLLVDFDHFSHDEDKPSQAAGWATELDNRADGVWAKIRWSDVGEAAVKGGRYRLISPVVDGSQVLPNREKKRVRPTRLVRLALTNDPNLKGMVPLSNRRAADADDADPSGTTSQGKKMKSVCTLLGLSPDASEEAVHAEVLKLKNRGDITAAELTTLRNRSTELETENKTLRGTRVTQALETYKNRFKPEKKDHWKKLLEADYESAIESLKDAAPLDGKPAAAPLHNRAKAGTPDAVAENTDTEDPKAAAKAVLIKNRANELQKANPVRGFNACWQQATAEVEANAN